MKNLLTPEEVKARATTPEKALDVSIEHHEENLGLSEVEVKGMDSGNILGRQICGLCVYCDDSCGDCILRANDQGCRQNPDTQFRLLDTALNNFHYGSGSFADYRVEQFKMVELLKKLKEQARLEAELEKAKVPEVKLGTYGYNSNGIPYIIANSRVHWLDGAKPAYPMSELPCDTLEKGQVEGNLAADLKRNAEDLEAFKMKLWGGNTLRMDIDHHGHPSFWVENKVTTGTLEQAIEIHQKLGQMIATLRRKNAKSI